ncbi:hypothetical protein BDFB_003847 [Asbolus verrucosus]|uniref:Uncharacterized protein n=1 Tax=Asbolus verrucosus TaxID=1661398 RepID=A0A482VGY3_ASBVE|nr:hypothetical protein BDFB_003847 [Asbolus verrucosus]
MNSFVVVFLAALACASAGIIASPAAQVLQGPSSRTTIVGPDGSAISAVAPGGSIVTDSQPAVVAQTVAAAPLVAAAPVVAGPAVVAAPSVLAARSVLAGPSLVAGSSVLTGLGGTVIAGPSGTISAAQPLVAPGVISAAVW